jgi:hypothetical protein
MKPKQLSLLSLSLIIALVGSKAALAQDASASSSPYFFGGKCSSQGTWTSQAMDRTQEIMDIAKRLKADPKCSKLAEGFMNSIPALQKSIGDSEKDRGIVGGLMGLQQQMTALSQFRSESAENRTDVVKLLLNRAVTYSAETAKMSASPAPAGDAPNRNEALAQNIFSFGKRLSQTTNAGLDIFNAMITQVADNKECPLNNNNGGQLFAASVNILSAYAGSGQSETGIKLSQAVSSLFTAFRDLKYSLVIRNGNETQLLNSVSCLIETTAESFCGARDARGLWEEMKNQTEVRLTEKTLENQHQTLYLADANTVSASQGTPLMGFYLLTQQLPLVNDWMLKILISVDPQLVTDGVFRNTILDNVNDFYKKVNDLHASYNNKVKTIRGYTDRDSQVNASIELLGDLVSKMTASRDGGTNFFTQSLTQVEIPFLLAGVPVPRSEIDPKFNFDFVSWFQLHKKDIPALQDPLVFVDHIGGNLDAVIATAQKSTAGYNNQWAIVDKQNVVDSTFLGVNFNVYEVLTATDKYLENLKNRLTPVLDQEQRVPVVHPLDPTIVGSILDTQTRIRAVLTQISNVRAKSNNFRAATENHATEMEIAAERAEFEVASRNFLTALYDQFNVILSRTGFLSNRLAVYVEYDLAATMRNQANSASLLNDPRFEHALKFATNTAAYNQILGITGGNPAAVRQDLDNSMNIGKQNIQMLENLFKDFFVRKIAEQRIRISHPQAGKATVVADSYERIWKDNMNTVPTSGRTSWLQKSLDKVTGLFGFIGNSLYSQNRYTIDGNGIASTRTVLTSDTEFGSAGEMYAQYCIQALAFNDLEGVWSVCKGHLATLKSPFNSPTDPTAKAAFEKYLNVRFDNKALEDFNTNRPLNESNRICALREFYRRNQVLYLTKGLHSVIPVDATAAPEPAQEAPVVDAPQPNAQAPVMQTPALQTPPSAQPLVPQVGAGVPQVAPGPFTPTVDAPHAWTRTP